jgi:hypothetical protein
MTILKCLKSCRTYAVLFGVVWDDAQRLDVSTMTKDLNQAQSNWTRVDGHLNMPRDISSVIHVWCVSWAVTWRRREEGTCGWLDVLLIMECRCYSNSERYHSSAGQLRDVPHQSYSRPTNFKVRTGVCCVCSESVKVFLNLTFQHSCQETCTKGDKDAKFSFVYRLFWRKEIRKCIQNVTVLDCFLALVSWSQKEQQDLWKKCIGHKMCILVFCTTFVENFFSPINIQRVTLYSNTRRSA